MAATAHRCSARARLAAALVLALVLGGALSSVALASAAPSGGPGSSGGLPSNPETPTGPSSAGSALGPGQTSLVLATIPEAGTAPYSWQWYYSTDGGANYQPAGSAECAQPRGTGALAGAAESCAFNPTAGTPPGTYHFELRVTDSATHPESATSPASGTVTVGPTLVSGGPMLDTDPQEDCTGTCSTTNWFAGTGGSGALVITTASANELLVLEVTDSGQTGAGLTTGDLSDTQGSTWHLESSHAWNGFGHEQYVFYALDATAGSDTVTLDSAAGSGTGATEATAVLSAFTGVDTSAPIAGEGTFETGTGTQSNAQVTTSVAPTTVLGIVSTTNGASAFTPTSSPAFTQAGTINDGAGTASFVEYYADTSTGTYTSEPTWTGSVRWGAVALAIQGASPLSVTVSPTTRVLDQGQTETITATATGGTGSLTYTWSVASGACPGFSNSGSSTLTYDPTGTTANCVLTVTVTDSLGDSAQPTTTASVRVNTGLAAPAAPTPSALVLDRNQAETITGIIPTTGTATYSWTWLVSVNGGAYAAETQCGTNGGAGAAAGATETCAIAANRLTAGDTYKLELQVTDSATTPETATSPASGTITVSAALTAPNAPTVGATKLDADQPLTATANVPTTGSAPYTWSWLVSVNGGAFGGATQCAADGGSGAAAGATEMCSVTGGTLTVGDTYAFELQVTDSATAAETATSATSSTVTVHSALAPPGTPTVSGTLLDANQVETITGTIPSTGTSPYSWQWEVSVNGAGFHAATQCATNSGSGAAAGATETCTIASGTLTAGDTYVFELEVTDGASTSETSTSAASSSVAVAAALSAPAAPSVSAANLDADQALAVHGSLPTTGTPTYSWQWMVSIDGGTYAAATFCSANSGTGASGGALVTCAIPAASLGAGETYAFELEVTDSASSAEMVTSIPSAVVTVNPALGPPGVPTVSARALDSDQAEAVTGTIPDLGTAPYSWQWYVSIDGGADVPASQCVVDAGSGASAGSVQTCSITAGELAPGSTYSYSLQVTDSSDAGPEIQMSSPSALIAVSTPLSAPAAPVLSASALSPTTPLSVTGTLPVNGTANYSWQWLISSNAGSYPNASVCGSSANGTEGAASGTVRCAVPAGALSAGPTYTFELEVTDSATLAEVAVSPASAEVTVVAPTITLGTNQGPTGATYSVSGSGFTASSAVTVSFGSLLLAPVACSAGSFSGNQITTDASGRFSCTFMVPDEVAGAYSIVATDLASSSPTASFSFAITLPTLSVSPTKGQVGDTVTVNGTGFSPSTPLRSLFFGSQVVTGCLSGSLTTNSTGAFSCTFAVPGGGSGSTVVATDAGGANATAAFALLGSASPGNGFGDSGWLAVAAVLGLVVIVAAVAVRRRRTSHGAGSAENPHDSSDPGPATGPGDLALGASVATGPSSTDFEHAPAVAEEWPPVSTPPAYRGADPSAPGASSSEPTPAFSTVPTHDVDVPDSGPRGTPAESGTPAPVGEPVLLPAPETPTSGAAEPPADLARQSGGTEVQAEGPLVGRASSPAEPAISFPSEAEDRVGQGTLEPAPVHPVPEEASVGVAPEVRLEEAVSEPGTGATGVGQTSETLPSLDGRGGPDSPVEPSLGLPPSAMEQIRPEEPLVATTPALPAPVVRAALPEPKSSPAGEDSPSAAAAPEVPVTGPLAVARMLSHFMNRRVQPSGTVAVPPSPEGTAAAPVAEPSLPGSGEPETHPISTGAPNPSDPAGGMHEEGALRAQGPPLEQPDIQQEGGDGKALPDSGEPPLPLGALDAPGRGPSEESMSSEDSPVLTPEPRPRKPEGLSQSDPPSEEPPPS